MSDSTVPNIFEYLNCNDLTSVPTFLAFFSTKYAVSSRFVKLSGEEAFHRSAQLGIESTPCMAGSIVMVCVCDLQEEFIIFCKKLTDINYGRV